MKKAQIHDSTPTGVLSFDLIDILTALKSHVLPLEWQCHDVDCFGQSRPEIMRHCQDGTAVSGKQLIELAQGIDQVIDGRFAGRPARDAEPLLILEAFDSSWWHAECSEACLAELKKCFRDVREQDA